MFSYKQSMTHADWGRWIQVALEVTAIVSSLSYSGNTRYSIGYEASTQRYSRYVLQSVSRPLWDATAAVRCLHGRRRTLHASCSIGRHLMACWMFTAASVADAAQLRQPSMCRLISRTIEQMYRVHTSHTDNYKVRRSTIVANSHRAENTHWRQATVAMDAVGQWLVRHKN